MAGGGGLYSKLITRKYQVNVSVTKTLGRSSGFMIGHSGDPDADYEVSYAYSSNSRMVGVVKGPGLSLGGAMYTFGNGDLLTKTSFKDTLTTKVSANFTYEPHRDLVQSVENKRDASPAGTLSKYEYANDSIGRRTSVIITGEGSTYTGGDRYWRYGYNDRSELTSADRCYGTNPGGGCTLMSPYQYDYSYDPIGNRTEHIGPLGFQWVESYYCTNSVNQYTQTDNVPDTCPEPPTPTETFTHDADGNRTQDKFRAYAWDGENRLIAVEPAGTPVNGMKKVEFAYDYMSRRVQKKVYVWDTDDWELTADECGKGVRNRILTGRARGVSLRGHGQALACGLRRGGLSRAQSRERAGADL